jgi:hypothetical protein
MAVKAFIQCERPEPNSLRTSARGWYVGSSSVPVNGGYNRHTHGLRHERLVTVGWSERKHDRVSKSWRPRTCNNPDLEERPGIRAKAGNRKGCLWIHRIVIENAGASWVRPGCIIVKNELRACWYTGKST